MVPRKVQAPALRAGHAVRFFEYLTVPKKKLAAWQTRQTDTAASWGVQWRCEYLPPATPWVPTSRERCAIAVLEKTIHQGRATTLSPALEALIHADNAALRPILERSTNLSQVDATDPESPGEKIFWQTRLPDLMGPDCWRWVVPQVGIEVLRVSAAKMCDMESALDDLRQLLAGVFLRIEAGLDGMTFHVRGLEMGFQLDWVKGDVPYREVAGPGIEPGTP